MSRLLAAVALAGSLASAIPLPLSSFDLTSRSDPSTAFAQCLDNSSLNAVVEGDPTYANASSPYNLRLPYSPVAIVYPENTQQVSAAVMCAAQNGVPANPRSGGHSYANFGLGGEDGHLIISLDKLNSLSLDGDIVTYGAGNRLGDVALGIWNLGKRALAHGTCNYVGTGGHALHGGFGLPSRAWGTLLDQVIEVEVVTGNGDIVTANNETNPDLFWAIRGAGSSFGVVTQFKAETHAAPEHNVWFTYAWNNLSSSEASDYLQKWQTFAQTLSSLAGLQVHVNPESVNQSQFVIDGYWYGDGGVAEANSTIAPLISQLSTPDAVTVEDQTWIDQLVFLAGVSDAAALNTSTKPDIHDDFFASSIFIPTGGMSQAASDAFMGYLWGAATEVEQQLPWYIIIDLWGGEQSYISSIGADATAFDSRDALYSIQVYGPSPGDVPPFPNNGIDVVKAILNTITSNQPETAFKGYANYVDSTLTADEAHAYYYPSHTGTLSTLKQKWDPYNVISYPQSFAPVANSTSSTPWA